jgi:hypothetical protein
MCKAMGSVPSTNREKRKRFPSLFGTCVDIEHLSDSSTSTGHTDVPSVQEGWQLML